MPELCPSWARPIGSRSARADTRSSLKEGRDLMGGSFCVQGIEPHQRDTFRAMVEALRRAAWRLRRWYAQRRRYRGSLREVRRAFPGLPVTPGVVSEEEKALEVFYRRYVGSVSPAHMTASWEVCLFLHRLVRLESLRRVSDIGSGFSSFILRSAVAGLSPPGFVHSVENDPEWKERTAQFLDSDASGRGALMGIERFLADPQAVDLDLIFHDLGGLDKRVSLFPVVLSRLRPGGVLVADDVHKPQVRSGLLRALRPGDEVVDLFANTHDAFGRHSLAVRVRSSVRAR